MSKTLLKINTHKRKELKDSSQQVCHVQITSLNALAQHFRSKFGAVCLVQNIFKNNFKEVDQLIYLREK